MENHLQNWLFRGYVSSQEGIPSSAVENFLSSCFAGNFQQETSNRIPPRAYETPSTITPCCEPRTRPPQLFHFHPYQLQDWFCEGILIPKPQVQKSQKTGAVFRVSILFTPKMPQIWKTLVVSKRKMPSWTPFDQWQIHINDISCVPSSEGVSL